jgi:outer membrane biosynthesis protein TonB
MKRCPQCEFIYEDDQSHCDMDGTRLTHDAHPLPKLQVLTTTSTSGDGSKARSRLVALVATLVLAGVMALVYYVSIRQPPRTTTVAISPTVEATQPNAEVSPVAASDSSATTQTETNEKAETVPSTENKSNTTDKPQVTESDTPKAETKPSTKPDTSRTNKSASQGRSTTQTSATTAKPEEKDDSKVRTALKKTGRFFKKALPF